MKLTLILFILYLLLIPNLSYSERTAYGIGTRSCGEWLDRRKNNNWLSMGEWMLGFVTAAHWYQVYELKDTDSVGLATWMDKYCTDHPLEKFYIANSDLVRELRSNK
jgi:hypothetical protein